MKVCHNTDNKSSEEESTATIKMMCTSHTSQRMDNVYHNNGVIHGRPYEQCTVLNFMHKQHNHNLGSYSADYCVILGFKSNLPLQPEKKKS